MDFRSIIPHCDARTLIMLMRTCRQLRDLVPQIEVGRLECNYTNLSVVRRLRTHKIVARMTKLHKCQAFRDSRVHIRLDCSICKCLKYVYVGRIFADDIDRMYQKNLYRITKSTSRCNILDGWRRTEGFAERHILGGTEESNFFAKPPESPIRTLYLSKIRGDILIPEGCRKLVLVNHIHFKRAKGYSNVEVLELYDNFDIPFHRFVNCHKLIMRGERHSFDFFAIMPKLRELRWKGVCAPF